MPKAKQGDMLSCLECGLVVTVDEICGCADVAIVCCDQPMEKGKLAAAKAKKIASAKARPGSVAKAAKPATAGKAKPKAKAAAKPAAKAAVKPAAKKKR